MQIKDKDLCTDQGVSRLTKLQKFFQFEDLEKETQSEFVSLDVDLPWEELQRDLPLAFEEFSWYGMIHPRKTEPNRSKFYGGLGLTYNPDYLYNIPRHAQGLGYHRGLGDIDPDLYIEVNKQERLCQFIQEQTGDNQVLNTYVDAFGFRERNEILNFKSFKHVSDMFDGLSFVRGRLAEVRGSQGRHLAEDFGWHRDEPNNYIMRILIPIVFDEHYFIELDSGTKIYFEKGKLYHWDTYNSMHRWNYIYNKGIIDRTCLVVGISPWLDYSDGIWSANKYANKIHPTDMLTKRIIL